MKNPCHKEKMLWLPPLTKLEKCSDQLNWTAAVYRPFTNTNKALINSLTTFTFLSIKGTFLYFTSSS